MPRDCVVCGLVEVMGEEVGETEEDWALEVDGEEDE